MGFEYILDNEKSRLDSDRYDRSLFYATSIHTYTENGIM